MLAYRHVDVAGPDWAPLERIVARTVRSRSLPTLDGSQSVRCLVTDRASPIIVGG